MTPKEKALELIQKYNVATWIKFDEIKYLTTIPNAKECALIAVDEILDACKTYLSSYYLEVKKEIEKL
jgi:hypothetical protein